MLNSHVIISTNEATRLIKRLCTHWAHKFAVEAEPNLGRIDFGGSQCHLRDDDASIHIELRSPDKTTAARMQKVVFDHLQSMGRNDLLQPVWSNHHVE